MLDAIRIEPSVPAKASVIWLHGLGADGNDFVPIVQQLHLPASAGIRFIFPHANLRPITLNNGYVMRGWYDISGLDRTAKVDAAGIEQSITLVNELILHEINQGIAPKNIILAGFSQGGAIALQAGLTFPERLGGIIGLSTYIPLPMALSDQHKHMPILLIHGLYDSVLKYDWGVMSRDLLDQLGFNVCWQSYPMDHEVCYEEIQAIADFIKACIGI